MLFKRYSNALEQLDDYDQVTHTKAEGDRHVASVMTWVILMSSC